MPVRAKFRVTSITEHDGYNGDKVLMKTIKMNPVYGQGDPNHENTKFWKSSPSGSLELGCANGAAAAQFEVGKEYYVDFTPADSAPQA